MPNHIEVGRPVNFLAVFSGWHSNTAAYTARRPNNADSTRTSTPPASWIAAAGNCSPARQRATALRLASPSTKNSDFACPAQPRRAQRHPLRRRLGCVEYGQHVRRVGRDTPVVAGKQARGVPVFTEPEQHQIEVADAAQRVCIALRRRLGTEFGGDYVHLILRNRHVFKPDAGRHPAVAVGIVRRQAALVAEVHLPARPVGGRRAQQIVHAARVLPPANTIKNRPRRSIARAAAPTMRWYADRRSAVASAAPIQRTPAKSCPACASVTLIQT